MSRRRNRRKKNQAKPQKKREVTVLDLYREQLKDQAETKERTGKAISYKSRTGWKTK